MYIQRIYFDRIIALLTFEHWIKFKSRANKNIFIKFLKTDYIYKSVSAHYCSFLNNKLQFLLQLFWHCFCFGSVSSFFLVLVLHSSSVTYWAPTLGVHLSVSYLFAFSCCCKPAVVLNLNNLCSRLQ